MAEHLFSMAYVSVAVAAFDEDDLAALLASSRATNSELGLTGMLLYRGGRFLQVLEGPEEVVRRMIDRIRHDPRHRDMRIVVEELIDHRTFSEWTMGYERMGVPSGPAVEGFRDSFDDLETEDPTVTARALLEIAVWFRVRSISGRAVG